MMSSLGPIPGCWSRVGQWGQFGPCARVGEPRTSVHRGWRGAGSESLAARPRTLGGLGRVWSRHDIRQPDPAEGHKVGAPPTSVTRPGGSSGPSSVRGRSRPCQPARSGRLRTSSPRPAPEGFQIACPLGGVVSPSGRTIQPGGIDCAKWKTSSGSYRLLHLAKARQVRSVVRLLPVGQCRVDVVLVRALRHG